MSHSAAAPKAESKGEKSLTRHQLEALITESIPSALNTYVSRILRASGFLRNLYDEDVELREVWRIFRKVVAQL